MSSQLEQDAFIEGLKEDGILDELNASLGRAEAPVEEETETVEEPAEEDTSEGQEEPEVAAVPDVEPEVEEPERDTPEPAAEESELFLDIEDPAVKEYLAKYDGDLTEAIRAAQNAQSLIGRQGNELGDVRRELAELREQVQAPQPEAHQPWQTYIPDPEEADETEMAAAYSSLAHEAFLRKDPQTLQHAVETWKDYDPFGASVFVSRLQAQIYEERFQSLAQSREPDELEAGMNGLKEKYPDLQSRVDEIGEEAARWPTLGYVLQEGAPAERVQALETLYLQVANRTSSETSQQALRRVAVQTSEEARRARQQAQVASSGRGSVAAPDATPHKIALGNTGRSVDLDRVDEILKSGRI